MNASTLVVNFYSANLLMGEWLKVMLAAGVEPAVVLWLTVTHSAVIIGLFTSFMLFSRLLPRKAWWRKLQFLAMLSFVWLDDEAKQVNEELSSLAENFREQAAMLVDLLDISIPMVAKLKVSGA
jgi:hypothetical protein